MKVVLPFKHTFLMFFVLIILWSLATIIYFVVIQFIDLKHEWVFRTLGAVILFIIETTLNMTPLYLYRKGLKKYSENHYDPRVPIDDRQDESMIEAARYTVLFGYMFAIVQVVAVIAIIVYVTSKVEEIKLARTIRYFLLIIPLAFKGIILNVAVTLSFRFSHDYYEWICCYLDKRVKEKYKIGIRNWNQERKSGKQ